MVKGSFYSEKLVDDSDFPATQLFIHHSKLHSFYLTSTCMFRLVPTYRSRHISRSLSSLQAHCTLFSASVKFFQHTSDGGSAQGIDFDRLFKSCNRVHVAKLLHAIVVVSGKSQSVFFSGKLVNVYAYIGDVSFGPHTFDHFCSCTKSLFRAFSYARKLFDDMPVRDMGCWNAMLSGYCQNGNAAEALDLLNEMRLEGFYKLANAQKVFDNMVVRDVVSWNSIIAAYEQNDDPDRALASFYDMLLTCSFMLTTCAF